MKRKRMYGDRLVEEPIFQSIGYAVDNTLAEQRIVVRIEDEYSDHAALTPSRPRRTGEGPIAHVIHWRKRAREPALRATRVDRARRARHRSEEHTSELQSLLRNSYAVFCLKKKKN